ncbi:MAG: hypothetical protein HYS98_08610 [Deltaproteobacteria bacterium]|nr:hypothetical protein [Deltaproteobacteria bacterium]
MPLKQKNSIYFFILFLNFSIPLNVRANPYENLLFSDDVPQLVQDQTRYALNLRKIVLRELLLTRIVLQNYLAALDNLKFNQGATLALQLHTRITRDPTLSPVLSLLEELENGAETVTIDQSQDFIERSLLTSWELFQYDLTLRKMKTEEERNIRFNITYEDKKPCLLTQWVGPRVYEAYRPVLKIRGGYNSLDQHPSYQYFLENIEQLNQSRRYTLSTFQLLNIPMEMRFLSQNITLYHSILAAGFEMNPQDFVVSSIYQEYPPEKVNGLNIDQALTQKSMDRIKKALEKGIYQALLINEEAIDYLSGNWNFWQSAISLDLATEVLEKLSFLTLYNYLCEKASQHYKSSLYAQLLNQQLLDIYEKNKKDGEYIKNVILGVSLASSILLGPSGWIAAGIFMTASTSYAILSYQQYVESFSQKEIISALYHCVKLSSLIEDEEWENCIEIFEGNKNEFYLSALALGLEPLFIGRFYLGLKATQQGGWQASRAYLKSLFIRSEPKGRFLPYLERKVFRLKNPKLSKLNWKTMWALGFIYLLADISTPQASEDTAKAVQKFNNIISQEGLKERYLQLSESSYELFDQYDKDNNTHVFSLMVKDHHHLEKNFLRFYDDAELDNDNECFVFLRNGVFYMPSSILKNGNAKNIVFEIAKHIYILTFSKVADKDSNPYKNNDEELFADAEKFAYECGGIPFVEESK